MKKKGSMQAKPSVRKKTARKMLSIPAWAYLVQISTTFFESSWDALVAPSSFMLRLMNSTARYAPVTTACMLAPVNQ